MRLINRPLLTLTTGGIDNVPNHLTSLNTQKDGLITRLFIYNRFKLCFVHCIACQQQASSNSGIIAQRTVHNVLV